MTMTANQQLVQRWWEELWNQGQLAVADEVVSPDFVDRDPSSPWAQPGVEGAKQLVTAYRTVFPDIHFTIERQVDAGDTVVSYWRCTGTHRGELMGIAPTGRKIEIVGISMLLLEQGKIAEQRVTWDTLGMLQQLGVVPTLG
jgi:steroid delta-isomerase-like uncharacterized protein